MKISAQMSIIIAAIFALISYSIAFTGFTSLGDITDPVQLSDAKGYAWFWVFLGTVAVVMGVVSYWIVRTEPDDGEG